MTDREAALLRMGQDIVDGMESAEDGDVLSQWMAHHLADLIDRAGDDAVAREECVALILDLWRHRASHPKHWADIDDTRSLLKAIKKHPVPDAPEAGWAAKISAFDGAVSFLRRELIMAASKDACERHDASLAEIEEAGLQDQHSHDLGKLLSLLRHTAPASGKDIGAVGRIVEDIVNLIQKNRRV